MKDRLWPGGRKKMIITEGIKLSRKIILLLGGNKAGI